MFERCAADGADLVSLHHRDAVRYLFCPSCSMAVLVLGRNRIRYRYRKGDLLLLDPAHDRALPHLEPFRNAIAQFVRTGFPFEPLCSQDGSRVPILAEAERVKLVWCDSCRLGT